MTNQDEFVERAARLANIVLAAGGALAASAFFISFYYYGWTGQRQFVSPLYLVLYYVVPLALAVFLFASLRFPPVHRLKLLLVCASAAASVYGLELVMESRSASLFGAGKPVMILLADSNDKGKDAAQLTKNFGNEIDTRTAREVLAALRNEHGDAVPITTPSNHLFIVQPDGSIKSAVSIDGREVLPLAGVSGKTTLLCNENGQWIDYESDERGFNNSSAVWHLDHLEIAALGDSFAHGYCVPSGKNFVALVRQRYPATLNLGVAGDGPLLMLATIQEYLPRLRPKVVLWFYYEGNDLTDLQTERKSALLKNYLQESFTQSALERQNDIDRAMVDELPRLRAQDEQNRARRLASGTVAKLIDFTKLSVLRQRLGLVGGMNANDREVGVDLEGPNMDAFRDILFQAKARTDEWGGRLYFVYLPEWARYTSYTSWGKSKRDDVLAIVRSQGIPIVDIDPAFRAHGDPLSLFPFRAVGHYNEAGHELVAKSVLSAISTGQ